MKTNRMFKHAVAQECVVLLNTNKTKVPTRVGQSWQPDVAQFLLDMFPGALDHGLELSDIAEMVSEDEFEVDFSSIGIFDEYDFDDMQEDDDL